MKLWAFVFIALFAAVAALSCSTDALRFRAIALCSVWILKFLLPPENIFILSFTESRFSGMSSAMLSWSERRRCRAVLVLSGAHTA